MGRISAAVLLWGLAAVTTGGLGACEGSAPDEPAPPATAGANDGDDPRQTGGKADAPATLDVLVGRVLLESSEWRQRTLLRDANVALLDPASGKRLYLATTGARGDFAFVRVAEGRYHLRIADDQTIYLHATRHPVELGVVTVPPAGPSHDLGDIVVYRPAP